ncbi:helix-turn-helix domain-containing protein [Roseivirga sp. BDSF3-8]|uniref:helix-turn-helix domain-containing protein n=1 Tax=Roseivirga sp. BDSF3-8 TaxID=3241598 RepID=UPI003531B7D5
MASKWINELRTDLGWTQTQMAAYLGIKRSLYSLVELGEREVSAKANIKLLELYQAAQTAMEAKAQDESPLSETEADERKALDAYIRLKILETEEALIRAKRQLEEAEKTRQKVLRAIRLQPILQEVIAKEPQPIQGLLKLQTMKMEKRLQKASLSRLLELRAAADALEAKLMSYKKGMAWGLS